MTSSKIDRIVKNAELFEQLSVLGTKEEAQKFLQYKGVSVIGDLTDPDQHKYFTIKNAPEGVRWQDVSLSDMQLPIQQSPDQPALTPPRKTIEPVWKPTHPKGLIPDGAPINPEIQKALIKFYPESATWIKIDGIMGPNTRGALNRYKTDYHDDRLIDDPEFQRDLIMKGALIGPMRSTMPKSFAALEEEIEQFEIAAARL